MGLFGGSDDTTSQEVTARGRQINRNTGKNVDVKSPEEFPMYNNALLLENDYDSEKKVGNEYMDEINGSSELPTHWFQFKDPEEVSWRSGDEYFAERVQELPENIRDVAKSNYEMDVKLSNGSTVSRTTAEILYGEHRYDDFGGQELPKNNDDDGSGVAKDVAEEAGESAVEEIVGNLI